MQVGRLGKLASPRSRISIMEIEADDGHKGSLGETMGQPRQLLRFGGGLTPSG